MSEQENTSGGAPGRTSPVVMVESASSKHTQLFRPTDMQDENAPDLHQKRAPAVASVDENWRDSAENPDTKDLKDSDNAMYSERHKHVAKNLSSNISSKRRGSSPAAIPMTPIETESKPGEIIAMVAPTQPILQVGTVASPIPGIDRKKEAIEKKGDDDSITSEITELRTPEPAKKTSEWSDEEEAGGLPRSESRASRVTRAVRQLFCCGVQLEAPSEDNVSSPRSGFFNSGI